MDCLRVALLYNLQHPAIADPDAPSDIFADQDRLETVQAVEQALRGAHVPALLEMLNIPYTGSGVLSHALALDKAAAKRIWEDRGLPTAPFQVMHHAEESLCQSLRQFPLFVKPLNESASAGIGEDAIVWDEAQLRQRVAWMVDNYHQPALVERFLPGREFSVAILGNAQGTGQPSMQSPNGRHSYRFFPVLELVGMPDGEPVGDRTEDAVKARKAKTSYTYVCPAPIPELAGTLQALSTAAFEAVSAVDLARVDFRCDVDGRPYLLEIDTLPSMEQGRSRYIKMAEAGGMPFFELVNTILGLAMHRYHLEISEPAILFGRNQEAQWLKPLSEMS